MLQSLADPVLPIFAVMMVGYILGRARVLGPTDARAINQFAFYLGVPAIIIWVVAKTPLDALDWTAVLLFLASQLTLYALVFAILHFGLKREVRESLLLGMSAVFVNHVFFVLPIAERLYGDVARAHMSGIVMFDAGLLFCGTVLLVERLGKSGQSSFQSLFKNPFIYAPFIGIALGLLGDAAPTGILTFAEFAARAAPPVLLFTLGIILAASPLFQTGLACWIVVLAKCALLPLVVFLALNFAGVGEPGKLITLLVAAGPAGAMPFVIAGQYGISTTTIAKVILITTILSVFSISGLTA